jgi:hypothetical protein
MKYLIKTRRYGAKGPAGSRDWRGKPLRGWTPWTTIATYASYEEAERGFTEWAARPMNKTPIVDYAAIFYDGKPFAKLPNGAHVIGKAAQRFWNERRK